jgi:hypothetical protein
VVQVARRELGLEAAITKLDKYQPLILDDIAYVTKDQAETSVLFELIATRYERRSLLITANQPSGEWGKIFAEQAVTLAAIDRLVHHAHDPVRRRPGSYPNRNAVRCEPGGAGIARRGSAGRAELEIPAPDHTIESGSGSHAEQTARIMIEFEEMNVESYRRRASLQRKRGKAAQPSRDCRRGSRRPCHLATDAKALTLRRFRGTADMERFSAPTDL